MFELSYRGVEKEKETSRRTMDAEDHWTTNGLTVWGVHDKRGENSNTTPPQSFYKKNATQTARGEKKSGRLGRGKRENKGYLCWASGKEGGQGTKRKRTLRRYYTGGKRVLAEISLRALPCWKNATPATHE